MSDLPRPNRAQGRLIAIAVLLYGVGYPTALAGGWMGGWVLVSLGGVALMALGVVTVRRIGRSDARTPLPRDLSE
ncbi:hypothetical protein N864_00995 [Intrasporangium chromatireducens Q5-1]|uniref:Uncharacterized protein n=1 Tax=Intrasporangium chromatireducens Q5-1 TaxID=584657 RepID=W9GRN3_9MICO|nr:hypothetical protein [Intrasporangium chromatireducens]EWT07712.1 hypothetical protein N864_00995 [Intrasporangium chromatireducens Q5-1]